MSTRTNARFHTKEMLIHDDHLKLKKCPFQGFGFGKNLCSDQIQAVIRVSSSLFGCSLGLARAEPGLVRARVFGGLGL